jgi:hypothetical protein
MGEMGRGALRRCDLVKEEREKWEKVPDKLSAGIGGFKL